MDSTISHSEAETFACAARWAAAARPGEVFALVGDLGAGKTHFAKGFAEALGIDPATVTSPTFTLVHEYAGGRWPLLHFDWYRLESEDETLRLGWDEYLAADAIVLVEWADKFPHLLPAGTRWLRLRNLPDGTREISEEER